MVTKEDLHRLIEELPQDEIEAARRYLEYLRNMGDPLIHALMQAPLDDEPETDEEQDAVKEGRADLAAGRVISHAELERDLGL